MSSAFKAWMTKAEPEQQQRLADLLCTSRAYLYQWANGHRTADAEAAGEVQRATTTIESEGGPPRVDRTEMNPACAACEYAQRCLKEKAR